MKQRILIVDDNIVGTELAAVALRSGGFEVVTCASPLAFNSTVTAVRPHIALIDVLMPALAGDMLVEIANRCLYRNNRAHVERPLMILYSGLPEADLSALAKRCGADGYISKSTPPAALATRLRAMLVPRVSSLAPDRLHVR